MKILVADDEVSVRVLVRRLLTKDFAVDIVDAPDGVAALNCLLSDTFDLLITDLSMPVMNGIETLASVRATPELAQLPVVVMTGHPGEEDFRRAQELGIVGFVVKPFSMQDFRSRVDPIVRNLLPQRIPRDAGGTPITLGASQRLLLVDLAPDFSATAEGVLSRLCRVELAKHEFAAIQTCMDAAPDAVVVGATSARLAPTALAQKIRGLAVARPLRVLAAVDPADRLAAVQSGLFDAVVNRDTDSAVFEQSLAAVLDDASRARLLLHPSSAWLDEGLRESARQFADRLGVSPTVHTTRPAIDDAVRWVASDVVVRGRGFGWTLRLRCPLDVALEMARLDDGGRDDEISEEHALRSVTAAVDEMARHWCERARARDLRCEAKPPSSTVPDCLGSGADLDTPRHARRWVSHGGRDLAILETAPAPARGR
jgi:CheY-like chemotaxis protein